MDNNILELYDQLSENIKKVEDNEYDNNILKDIENEFLNILELIKLFLISERDSYYGYFMMNLSFLVNYYSNNVAGIKLNTYPPVFELNPLLLGKFSIQNIIYIVCHEIDHIVYNHPTLMVNECKDDNSLLEKFNIAADAAVNDALNAEIIKQKHNYMSFPEGCVTSETIKDMLGKKVSVYQDESYRYYFDLIKDKNIKKQSNFKTPKKSDDNEKGNGSFNDNKEEVITVNNTKEIEDHKWTDSDDQIEIQECVKELMNEVNNTMNEETRGLMPARYIEAIEKINAPAKIKWESLLKKYIGTISANNAKTRTRLNRRQPERFDLSGNRNDKVLKIVVAIDTSGSMSDDDIAKVFNEIFAIIGKRKHEITVIECDAEINKVYKAKSTKDIELKVIGRGGTSFVPVIEYINENRYFRDALLIYFTDGFGDYSIPKPKTYRNLWVILGKEDNLSLDEPYGLVTTLK